MCTYVSVDVKDKKKSKIKKNPTDRVKFFGASRPETRTFLYRPYEQQTKLDQFLTFPVNWFTLRTRHRRRLTNHTYACTRTHARTHTHTHAHTHTHTHTHTVQTLTLHWITLSTLLMMAHKAETAVQGWSVDPINGGCQFDTYTGFLQPG